MEKKRNQQGRRLKLNKKAIRRLTDDQLEGVVGGVMLVDDTCSACCPSPPNPKETEATYNSRPPCR